MVQVVDVEPSSPTSHELLPAWGQDTVEGSLRKGLCLAPSAIPRCAISSSISLDDLLGNNSNSSSSFGPLGGYDSSTDGTPTPAASSVDDFFFTWAPHEGMHFDFPEPATQTTRQEPKRWKRIRHGQDVDGPNTASLSCKKRRLRTELITSRLSQPYSLPATHILNREGAKQGDKRFAKIATSYDVARRAAHLHATSFLRFSVMNRLRRRLGLGHPGQRVQVEEDARESTWSKAPWQSSTWPTVSAGAKHLRSSREALIASSARAMGHASFKVQTLLSQPAALPLPTCDLAAARKRTSPRIHPVRSPELHPERSSGYYDELDDDGFSYLHCDDGAGLSEDPEQVYSDFGVIFGNGTSTAAAEEDHSYEEYLDELDGISWVTI
ncbi:uncharacterized protein F5Z01DRAFT_344015 [Emericellopsis atlantica]|uniref:Uncharacterized protein n=1 Tax=Emericellopsis atlantica TaxID=2614577 RepID=A0A9P7ZF73_9HYPO|nr:uncharacterized protein F5Z01DRAFT_344015 [Emericellopsis atlantica]KAG9250717.1 hypothetical protein F5Z01DRAFT_344015 [Emericellopsis atlantica]